MAYQGSFPKTILELAGLPEESFSPEGLEFWGRANLLKAGIVYSQIINTVSRKYSQEIQTAEYGYGLEGILSYRKDDLVRNPQRGGLRTLESGNRFLSGCPLYAGRTSPEKRPAKKIC